MRRDEIFFRAGLKLKIYVRYHFLFDIGVLNNVLIISQFFPKTLGWLLIGLRDRGKRAFWARDARFVFTRRRFDVGD